MSIGRSQTAAERAHLEEAWHVCVRLDVVEARLHTAIEVVDLRKQVGELVRLWEDGGGEGGFGGKCEW